MNSYQTKGFNDKYRVGEEFELPTTHELATTHFIARSLEIQAIRDWATTENIQLRSEYCIEKIREGEETKAKILSYDPKKELQQINPPPLQYTEKQVLVRKQKKRIITSWEDIDCLA